MSLSFYFLWLFSAEFCEFPIADGSTAGKVELTMARIAALSGAGSFTHDSTTESKP
jgi:hypothetical protein